MKSLTPLILAALLTATASQHPSAVIQRCLKLFPIVGQLRDKQLAATQTILDNCGPNCDERAYDAACDDISDSGEGLAKALNSLHEEATTDTLTSH